MKGEQRCKKNHPIPHIQHEWTPQLSGPLMLSLNVVLLQPPNYEVCAFSRDISEKNSSRRKKNSNPGPCLLCSWVQSCIRAVPHKTIPPQPPFGKQQSHSFPGINERELLRANTDKGRLSWLNRALQHLLLAPEKKQTQVCIEPSVKSPFGQMFEPVNHFLVLLWAHQSLSLICVLIRRGRCWKAEK